jgi:carboxymethylenebutenolidase
LRAAVSFYGKPGPPFDWLDGLQAAILYHWAGADDTVSEADLEQFRRIAQERNKRVIIQKYEGAPHAFCNETRKETYRADAAQLAWDRTVDFLADSFQADLQKQ